MTRLGGDEIARRLLAPVLDWSAERIAAFLGGWVLLSPRHEPVASAWGSARSPAQQADAQLANRLQGQLFPPSQPSRIARSLDRDRSQAPVVELDLAELGPAAGRCGDLLARRGLDAPLLAVLRDQGRVGGLVWLSPEAGEPERQRESARALRGLQPLLELAQATARLESHAGFSAPAVLSDRGLTPRELVVAEQAIEGAGNAAIAGRLGIAEKTVKNHMTQILAKCGVRSRTQLIAHYQHVGKA